MRGREGMGGGVLLGGYCPSDNSVFGRGSRGRPVPQCVVNGGHKFLGRLGGAVRKTHCLNGAGHGDPLGGGPISG